MTLNPLSVLTPENQAFVKKMHQETSLSEDTAIYRICDQFNYNIIQKIKRLTNSLKAPSIGSRSEKERLASCHLSLKSWSRNLEQNHLRNLFLTKYALIRAESSDEDERLFRAPFFFDLNTVKRASIACVVQTNTTYHEELNTFKPIMNSEKFSELKSLTNSVLSCQKIFSSLLVHKSSLELMQQSASCFYPEELRFVRAINPELVLIPLKLLIQTIKHANAEELLLNTLPLSDELLMLCDNLNPSCSTDLKFLEDRLYVSLLGLWKLHGEFKEKLTRSLSGDYDYKAFAKEFGIPDSAPRHTQEDLISKLNQSTIFYAETAHQIQQIVLDLHLAMETLPEFAATPQRFGYNKTVHKVLLEKLSLLNLNIQNPVFLDIPEDLAHVFSSSIKEEFKAQKKLFEDMSDYQEFSTLTPLLARFESYLSRLMDLDAARDDVLNLRIYQEQLEQMIAIFLKRTNSLLPFIESVHTHFVAKPVAPELKESLVKYLDELTATCIFIMQSNHVIFQSCYALFEDLYFTPEKFRLVFETTERAFEWEDDIKVYKKPEHLPKAKKALSPCGGAGKAPEEPEEPLLPVKNCSSHEVLTLLRNLGFKMQRQKGSHAILKAEDSELSVTCPVGYKTLKLGTLRSILRQAGLK